MGEYQNAVVIRSTLHLSQGEIGMQTENYATNSFMQINCRTISLTCCEQGNLVFTRVASVICMARRGRVSGMITARGFPETRPPPGHALGSEHQYGL